MKSSTVFFALVLFVSVAQAKAASERVISESSGPAGSYTWDPNGIEVGSKLRSISDCVDLDGKARFELLLTVQREAIQWNANWVKDSSESFGGYYEYQMDSVSKAEPTLKKIRIFFYHRGNSSLAERQCENLRRGLLKSLSL